MIIDFFNWLKEFIIKVITFPKKAWNFLFKPKRTKYNRNKRQW